MTVRLLCLLALALTLGVAVPARAQDADEIENPFELLGGDQSTERQDQEPEGAVDPIQTQETEAPSIQDQEPEALPTIDDLEDDLLEPFGGAGDPVESEAPLDVDPAVEAQRQEEEQQAEEAAQELEPEQRQEVEDIAQTAEETSDTIQDIREMPDPDAEALVQSEEELARQEVEATQQAAGATDVLRDQVVAGEPGYGTMVPVPSHDTAAAVSEEAGDARGKGMHSFWENLLDGVLQGAVNGFQRRYAVAKLNQMKARADRLALLGKSGNRPVVDKAVRSAVRQTGLTRLGNSDPRLSDLMLGRNRTNPNPLRPTSGGPSGSGTPVQKIEQYRLPTAHDKITGKPMMRADGVTPIKTVNLALGSGGGIPLRRR